MAIASVARKRVGQLAGLPLMSPRTLGAIGLAGAIAFVGSSIFLQVVGRADPLHHLVSDFANGPYGSLFVVATVVHGVANLAIARGIRITIRSGAVATRGARLFAASAAGIVLAGLFPSDPTGAARTTIGNIHATAAAASFASEWFALAAFTSAFRASGTWRRYASLSGVTTCLAAVTLAAFAAALGVGGHAGLAERASLVVFLAWELAVALRLVCVRA